MTRLCVLCRTSQRLSVNSHRRTWRRSAPGARRSMPRTGISNLRKTWPQVGATRSRRRRYKTSKLGGVRICETPRHAFWPPISNCQRMCSVWPTAAMPCCARIPVIRRCISGRRGTSGRSVSASITAPWLWNTRAIWSGSGSAGVPTTTGCSGRRRPSPGIYGFPHTSQGWGVQSRRARMGNRQELFGGLTRTHAEFLQFSVV